MARSGVLALVVLEPPVGVGGEAQQRGALGAQARTSVMIFLVSWGVAVVAAADEVLEQPWGRSRRVE
jgi:hypothetical protein